MSQRQTLWKIKIYSEFCEDFPEERSWQGRHVINLYDFNGKRVKKR